MPNYKTSNQSRHLGPRPP